jgi:hypothetical protein
MKGRRIIGLRRIDDVSNQVILLPLDAISVR